VTYLLALVIAIVAVYAGWCLLEAVSDPEAGSYAPGPTVAVLGFLTVAVVVAATIPVLVFG